MDLEKIKTIDIKGDKFTFDISQVSVSDILSIEVEKQRLSESKYYEIATTYFVNTLNAATLIDMISLFRVLKPEIEQGLTGKNFETLNILEARELLSIYVNNVATWFQSWMKEFNSPFETKEKDM